MPLTHYEILGLKPTASTEEIKRAYRHQALHWHPDRNPNNPKAHRRFIAIKDAYSVLSKPDRRAYYDSVLRQRESAKQAPPPQFDQPPRPQGTPYTAPKYRPVYRERPRNGGWSGGAIALLVFILFRLVSTCNERQYKTGDAEINLNGLRKQDNRVAFDSLIREAGGLDRLVVPADTSPANDEGSNNRNLTKPQW